MKRFVPSGKVGVSGLCIPATLNKDILMPGRGRQGFWTTLKIGPVKVEKREFFSERHFSQRKRQ
ncbi:MAG: hypothetical protein WCQ50_05745 [Spirochaetota bacterium]